MTRNLRMTPGRRLSLKSFAPGIVCFIAVFVLVVLPESDLPQKQSWLDISFLDKIVHCIMFAVMTFLFLMPIGDSSMFKKEKRHYFIRIAISVCLWGLTTEFIQKFYVPSRSFDLLDWAADCLGVLIAWIYCRKFHWR